jgi:hypothetical protein
MWWSVISTHSSSATAWLTITSGTKTLKIGISVSRIPVAVKLVDFV